MTHTTFHTISCSVFCFLPPGLVLVTVPLCSCVDVCVHGDRVLPQVEPLCVFREVFWYGAEVSKGTVDLFDAWTATAPWTGWGSIDGGDLETTGWEEYVTDGGGGGWFENSEIQKRGDKSSRSKQIRSDLWGNWQFGKISTPSGAERLEAIMERTRCIEIVPSCAKRDRFLKMIYLYVWEPVLILNSKFTSKRRNKSAILIHEWCCVSHSAP